jgi:hypothetical protein
MFEFDMHEVEFLDPADDDAIRRAPKWSPTMELHAELGLLSVAESQAERQLRR